MSHAKELINQPRKYPFKNMRIADHTVLDSINGRNNCPLCLRSRKFFCYNCYIPVGNLAEIIPTVKLPINVDIIKHKKEIDGKSTAVHAAVLAPDNVKIYTYPNIPDYRNEQNNAVLIYPSIDSVTVEELFNKKINRSNIHEIDLPKGYNRGTLLKSRVLTAFHHDNENYIEKFYYKEDLPITKAVFIDSTWNQSRGIYKDDRIKCLKPVVLQNRCSQFWRHQKGSPRWYLATIEAIHQFLLEVHVTAWGLNMHYKGLENLDIDNAFFDNSNLVDYDVTSMEPTRVPYNGQYDNLMYFFANMYDLIHRYYNHNELKSYRRPIY